MSKKEKPNTTTVNDNAARQENEDSQPPQLEFVEEPCGIPADKGWGYLQVEFGERIGPEGRYEILRKLGWGMYSSVWLAKDLVANRFVAVKALTGHATRLYNKGIIFELQVLRLISQSAVGHQQTKETTHCLTLLAEFVHPGKDKDGEHLCLVTDVLGPSVAVFRKQVGRFTKPLIKKMLKQTLIGLMHLHSYGIAHTDLRPENMLLDLGTTDIQKFITENPASRHPPEQTWGENKFVRVAVSQPFPIPPFEEWIARSFVIGDFGSAQFINKQVSNNITPVDLRAPEVIVGLPWDEKVDIWTFGCLVFELLNNQKLVKGTHDAPDPEGLALWQILNLTRERYSPEAIRSSPVALKYLDPETSWLKDDHPVVEMNIYSILKKIGSLRKDEDLLGVGALLKKCLCLNPKDRYSAMELLEDPWLNAET